MLFAVETPGLLFGAKPGEITADHLGSDLVDIYFARVVDPLVESVLVVLQRTGA